MKTVVITGASRGIGKATAEKFLKEGWRVIGTARSAENWEHDRLSWLRLDLTDATNIERAVNEIAAYAPLDVLINNAGDWPDEEETARPAITIETLRHILEVNLIGTIDFTERLLAASVIKEGGHIMFTGSGSGVICDDHVGDDVPSYRISKTGLHMYARTLAARLKKTNSTVSVLDPGWVQTEMGGDEAPRSPEEPASDFFELATSDVLTGAFWREGTRRTW